jgi:hypothetical protein
MARVALNLEEWAASQDLSFCYDDDSRAWLLVPAN